MTYQYNCLLVISNHKIQDVNSFNPFANSPPVKSSKKKGTEKQQKAKPAKHADPFHGRDPFETLPDPEPAIKLTEVNLANAPITKKDHDYRPVMFAGCRDLEGRLHVSSTDNTSWQKVTDYSLSRSMTDVGVTTLFILWCPEQLFTYCYWQ